MKVRVFTWEVVDVVRSVTSVVFGDVGEVSFCCCEVVGEVVDSSEEMAGSVEVPIKKIDITQNS